MACNFDQQKMLNEKKSQELLNDDIDDPDLLKRVVVVSNVKILLTVYFTYNGLAKYEKKTGNCGTVMDIAPR